MKVKKVIGLVLVSLMGNWGSYASVNDNSSIVKNFVPTASFTASTVCEGNATVFANTSTTLSGSIVTNIWDFGDGESSAVLNPQHTFANSGTFSVTLTVINSAGDVDTFTNSVLVDPAADIDFLVSAPNNCERSTFTFTNLSNVVSGSITGYSWDFGDGSTTTIASPTYTYADHGIYTITLSATTDNFCMDSYSAQIEVYAEPIVDFTVENICMGTAVQFINNSQVATGNMTYLWTFGDGNSSTQVHPEHIYATANTYSVNLTATTENGCVISDIQSVTTHPIPTASFTTADVCFGTDILFTNTSSISAGAIGYLWSFGDGNTSTNEHPIHNYSTQGIYEVVLTVTSNNNCEQIATQYVTVDPTPIAAFTTADVCFGNAVVLTNTTAVVTAGITYLWEFGDGNTSTEVNPIHDYIASGDYNIALTVTTPEGCFDEITKPVSINIQPEALFDVNDNCLDSPTAFVNNSVVSGTGIVYEWNFGDGQVSSLENPAHQYGSAGTYNVTLVATSISGCFDIYSESVKISPIPTATFIASDVCETESVSFSNLSTISSGTLDFEWSFGDGESSTDANPIHFYTDQGTYTVTLQVTSEVGCISIIDKTVSIYPKPITNFSAPSVCDAKPILFENLSTISSGTIVEYLWDFGDQTNAVVQHPSKEYLNQGTYQVKLSITSDQGCKDDLTQEVVVKAGAIANFSVEDICVGSSIEPINESSITSGNLTYAWDFGDDNFSVSEKPSHQYDDFGVYSILLVVTSDTGCKDSIARPVIVRNSPTIEAGEDATVSQGHTTQLEAQGGSDYNWEPITDLNNSNIANPLATPLETTTYEVQVVDQYGCAGSDEVTVFVEEDFKLVANNVMTPDGNGQNDTWIVDNIETFGDVNVRVYDRWGRAVFEQRAYQNDWGGTSGTDILPDGTYYYYITFDQSEIVYRGALTIIRNNQ